VPEAASYVDRILRGANPAELPVQLPTRYELAINMKTARMLGISVPNSLQLLANEVISDVRLWHEYTP
jgi:putative ABC transport system substrate-binding protein